VLYEKEFPEGADSKPPRDYFNPVENPSQYAHINKNEFLSLKGGTYDMEGHMA
jgi:hypothetical protein